MLPLPSELSQLSRRISTVAASLLGFVIRMSTTTPAANVSDFPMFTKRRSSL